MLTQDGSYVILAGHVNLIEHSFNGINEFEIRITSMEIQISGIGCGHLLRARTARYICVLQAAPLSAH